MKRNHTNNRALRNGMSPYKRHAKRPCQHCQQITQHNAKAAQRGETVHIEECCA
jgi:hypothetical protein